MSDAITWRSMTAPDFRSSAAIMSAGNESINQGINSLAALAKGYVDEQKGIAVSNAVADLSNTTNDADRRSVFAAHSAKLRDSGIDLKEFIAADQAKHASITADGVASDNHAMSASNILTNTAKQAGLAIENNMNQGKFDYQKTEQQQQTDAAAMAKLTGEFNIANGKAQTDIARSNAASNALSASASADHARAGTKALGDAAAEKERGRNSALEYDKIANSKDVLKLNPATGQLEADQGMIHDVWIASGRNPLDLIVGRAAYNAMLETDKKEATTLLADTRKHEGDLITHKQAAKDDSKAREASLASELATLDTDWWSDDEHNKGAATLTAAYARTFIDSNGNTAKVPTSIINVARESAASDGDLSGDAKLAIFNNIIDKWITKQQQGKGKDKPNADPMEGINK